MDYKKYIEFYNEYYHFMRYNGMKLIALEKGYSEVEMELNENFLNINGTLHGGTMFSLADVAAGSAARSHGITCVTLNSNINFIKPVRAGKVKAIASEVHKGRTTGVYRVELLDENNDMLAWCTFTMFFTGGVIVDF